MSLDILRRTGGWCVELIQPVIHKGVKIDQIEIRSPDLSQVARWGRGEIPSTMRMLQELSDTPEIALLSLKYPDVDRVLMAYYQVVPQSMKDDFTNSRLPLITPPELMTEETARTNDQLDPRFPKADGPVRRFEQPPKVAQQSPEPEPDFDDVKIEPRDDIMRVAS
jgi:hypothetical protein